MTSQELTGWMALLMVHQKERAEAEETARYKAGSDDGEVFIYGKREDEWDEDDENGDLENGTSG
jgi:hypothetical protein